MVYYFLLAVTNKSILILVEIIRVNIIIYIDCPVASGQAVNQ